jgi:Prp8 binding protein
VEDERGPSSSPCRDCLYRSSCQELLGPAYFHGTDDDSPQGEIISCRFDQTGERIAAASADKCICTSISQLASPTNPFPTALWKTYPPHDNYGFLPNVHKQAVTDLAFSPSNSNVLYSVGADGMLIATDLSTSERLVRYAAHYGPVNSLAVTRAGTSAGRELLLTGGDDGVARVWDPAREGKDPVVELDDGLGGVVTAVEWSADGSAAFVGGVDNEIKVSIRVWLLVRS